MNFFVDANVIVYAIAEGPPQAACERILETIAAGEAEGATSVAVLEEVWHLELGGRIPELEGQTRRARVVFDQLLAVGAGTLDLALALDAPDELGANDRLHVAACREHSIPTIVTADRAFDSIAAIERVDPFDRDAVESLLAA